MIHCFYTFVRFLYQWCNWGLLLSFCSRIEKKICFDNSLRLTLASISYQSTMVFLFPISLVQSPFILGPIFPWIPNIDTPKWGTNWHQTYVLCRRQCWFGSFDSIAFYLKCNILVTTSKCLNMLKANGGQPDWIFLSLVFWLGEMSLEKMRQVVEQRNGFLYLCLKLEGYVESCGIIGCFQCQAFYAMIYPNSLFQSISQIAHQ